MLPILKEVADSYVPGDIKNNEAQENLEDPTTVILGVVANIFQKIIELLARRLRKEPEEGKEVDSLLTYMNFLASCKVALILTPSPSSSRLSCVSQPFKA